MKALIRIVGVLASALFLAVIITAATEPPKCAHAGCGSDTTWNTSSELNSSQSNTGTEDISSSSVQHSDDGQTYTDTQTHHKNADGSSTDHEETHYEDKSGNGCSSDGEPWTGDRTVDDETDKDGNRKEHIEEIIEKDGKCMKQVRDREWDRKGKLIKDTGWITTEVPCNKYILEFTREGNLSAGGITVHWGPDTAIIPLGLKSGNYTGSQNGSFHATVSGKCNGTYNYPESAEVTAKEDEFGDLEFSVIVTMSMAGTLTCPGGGGPLGNAPVTFTRTFTLPFEDGASKVFTVPMGSGQTVDTFTLKKRTP